MSDLSVSILPRAETLANAFKSGNITQFIRKEINRTAFSVERYAKQLTPVATNRLRSSINTQPLQLGMAALVSTNTEYAIFVHNGTKYMRGRPFMHMGAALAQVNILTDINKRLDTEFVTAFKSLR